MKFKELIGNNEIKESLMKILSSGNISHSYMFIGTRGIGKDKFAKEFAKGILCLNDTNKPCENCKSCVSFSDNNNPDFYEIELEEDENSIKIDTIRDMQKKIQELPIISNRKVYIINDSEFMTKDAQNCLLKTLEEPPKFTTIILIVSNESKILNTIKSRCLKIYFKDINENELEQYIKQNLITDNFTPNMLKACQGSIGKATNILKNKEMYTTIDEVFENVENYSLIDVVPKLEILYKNKEHINEMLEYINVIFIEKAKNNFKYIDYISCVEKTKNNLNMNCNYDMCIDKMLFEIWKE